MERKASVDKLLMEYKRENSNFCYIIRNAQTDIKVLIKKTSEGSFLPYRDLSLDVLGALTPLKTITKDELDLVETPEDEDQFVSPGRRNRRPNYIPKEMIFKNITAILDGFETQRCHQRN